MKRISSADLWPNLRPSSQPALSLAELQGLPPGNLVLTIRFREGGWCWSALRIMATDPPRGCLWTPIGWGDPLDFDPARFELRLPRLTRVSCSQSIEAVRQRRKTVSRRVWRSRPKWAEAGRWILLVDKRVGANAAGLAVVELVDVRAEPLAAISPEDVRREGFPELTPDAFVEAFCRNHPTRLKPDTVIHRLEWSYLDGDPLFD